MVTSFFAAVARFSDALVELLGGPTSGFLSMSAVLAVVAIVLAARRRSPVGRLSVVGAFAIAIALLHVLFGSYVPDDSGLWTDREALPSVLASLGSSLIAFAGIAWSLEKDGERRRTQARKDEQGRQLERLRASISEVTRAVDHCDQLARRGWQLLDRGLRPLAEPLLARRPEGGASLWFEILEENRRRVSQTVTEIPATPSEVWSALQIARGWDDRLVERIESIATNGGRRFRRSGETWLEEYERLRADLAGLDDALPLDLMPFVDDLELIRDLLRHGEQDDATDGEGAALLLAFALVLSGLEAMSDPTGGTAADTATYSAGEASRKGEPEEMLERLWRPGGKTPSRSAVEMLGLAADEALDTFRTRVAAAMLTGSAEAGDRSFTRDRHWTDVIRPSDGPGSPDVTTREAALKRDFRKEASGVGSGVLFQIVLLMLAPKRRKGLIERSGRLQKSWKAQDQTSPEGLPTDTRDLWARIIKEMTGPDGTNDAPRDEPRRTASGGSLRPRLSELAPPHSDSSEGNPADLWRLFENRERWEDLSDDEDPSDDLVSDLDDDGPIGWTTPD